jgi:hypothetical protein
MLKNLRLIFIENELDFNEKRLQSKRNVQADKSGSSNNHHYYDNIKISQPVSSAYKPKSSYDSPIVVKYNENALLNKYNAELF